MVRTFVKKTVRWLVGRTGVGSKALVTLDLWPYLEDKGWVRSRRERLPVDRDGDCLPWYSYSMIAFLSDKVRPDMRVFEYGSGYSTLWWARRVAHVTSCEHDQYWYDTLNAKVPSNVDLRYCELDTDGARRTEEAGGVRLPAHRREGQGQLRQELPGSPQR